MDNGLDNADLRLAQRLADLRQQRAWSLEELAQRTGLSRATLSRVERAETSPTASLLNRLCAAYGLTMSRLLSEIEDEPPELLRPQQQPVWVDRASGFHRRSVSPPLRCIRLNLSKPGSMPARRSITTCRRFRRWSTISGCCPGSWS